ncbi:MAG: class I SAM-dependent methyltransferase [Planctomycetota bacterium]|nr:class I SAM-dependent methyltransferase [Planctomycetota bacterium]
MPGPRINCVWLPPWSREDEALATRFGITRRTNAESAQWALRRTATGALSLSPPTASDVPPIELDPSIGALKRRLETARVDQPLPRAIGLHRRKRPYPLLCDATAGLGRDAMLLAQLGCPVLAIEHIPPLAALVADASARASLPGALRVQCADAVQVLSQMTEEERPAVVYLDPMFAQPGRAQVKKEMQVCRMLAEDSKASDSLLRAALTAARERVVIKRHPQHPELLDNPSFTVTGERVRFDVYLNGEERHSG